MLVFVWRALLLLAVDQPVPSNDAFFYDGPVVHLLNHGGYFNPSVAQSRPISGTEFFCAYPPLYQLVLLGWMSLWGTSVFSAMVFHLALFGGFALTMLAIFRRLKVPALAANLASLFLLAITFDDRPDGLACLLGALAVYALARWLHGARGWAWCAALFCVLTFCTSLQIGGLISFWIFISFVAAGGFCRIRLPFGALAAVVFVPLTLAMVVRFWFPHLWAGFQENLHGTAVGGLHLPSVASVLKVVRNVPAVFLMSGLLAATAEGRRWWRARMTWGAPDIIFAAGLLGALGFLSACLLCVPPNWVGILNYFQPVLVGIFLAAATAKFPELLRARPTKICLALLVGLVAVRAVGLTTWGVAGSVADSYAAVRQRLATELDSVPPHANILLSCPYLYEADRHTNGNWIHADYAPLSAEGENFPLALRRLHAAKLVLTQFDYYRRYQRVLADLRAAGDVQITVTNLAHLRSPDSYAHLQRILQDITWAPVVVDLEWK